MNRTGYTVLGWVVWQVASRVAKRKVVQNRAKLGAAAGVAALAVAGAVIAVRAAGSDE